MQVVPSTMGREAAAALFNAPRLFSPAYLLDPAKNIEVGTAYLGKLYNEQVAGITSPDSRWYFVQAAYKIGLPEAARLFDAQGRVPEAIARINGLAPAQVLQQFTRLDAAQPLRDYFADVQQARSQLSLL